MTNMPRITKKMPKVIKPNSFFLNLTAEEHRIFLERYLAWRQEEFKKLGEDDLVSKKLSKSEFIKTFLPFI